MATESTVAGGAAGAYSLGYTPTTGVSNVDSGEYEGRELFTVSDSQPTTNNLPHFAPIRRPRRLRTTPAMRALTTETRLDPADLILPLFIAEGHTEPREISSMPGVYQHTLDSLIAEVSTALESGIRCVDLFGVPLEENKDAEGTQSFHPEGILNVALRTLRREFGEEVIIMADTCLDEFTDHGHCGAVATDRQGNEFIDNDRTLELYRQMAVAQAEAGAHIVSPSGMMDGQVAAIRDALDEAGHRKVAIMAYSAKYASAFYGPFREAVGSSLTGDRRTYQQDPANYRESLLEAQLDIDEGADFVMVKPALPYLDVLAGVAEMSPVPVAAYQVSGEYAMIEAAGRNGWVDRDQVMMESLLSIKRAGADQILTYFAIDAAQRLRQR